MRGCLLDDGSDGHIPSILTWLCPNWEQGTAGDQILLNGANLLVTVVEQWRVSNINGRHCQCYMQSLSTNIWKNITKPKVKCAAGEQEVEQNEEKGKKRRKPEKFKKPGPEYCATRQAAFTYDTVDHQCN